MIEAKVQRRQLIALARFLESNVGEASEAALQGIVTSIMDGARARWVELATEKLKSTAATYIAGIQPVVGDPATTSARVELLGKLPNLVEQGMSAMDLHQAFLAPGKGRRTSSGWARAIPFRHATPGAGYAAGVPMGAAYAGHANVASPVKLGRAVHKAALQLAATTSTPSGGVAWGGRLREGLAPMLKPYPVHLTDIYAGMYRQEKTYENATQNQYITFRTISIHDDGSPNPQGTWIHPGIPPAMIAEEVAEYIEEIALPAALAYLGQT